MTLTEFKIWALNEGSVAKYNDSQFKGECVSLINQYCYRVLGIPANAWGHAKDWATNPSALTHFNKVDSVQAGDVLVYGATSGNPYGHIEIALGGGQALGQNRNLDGRVRVAPMLNNYNAVLRSKKGGANMQPITPAEVNNLLGLMWGVVTDPSVPGYNATDRGNDHKNLDGKPFYEAFNTIYQDPRTFEYADRVYKALHGGSTADQYEPFTLPPLFVKKIK